MHVQLTNYLMIFLVLTKLMSYLEPHKCVPFMGYGPYLCRMLCNLLILTYILQYSLVMSVHLRFCLSLVFADWATCAKQHGHDGKKNKLQEVTHLTCSSKLGILIMTCITISLYLHM